MKLNEISILIVSFKSDEKLLLSCLNSVKNIKNIFILENSNNYRLKKIINKKFPNINFFLSKKNIGYPSGHNFLLKKVKTKYSLLLNADSKISYDSISKLIKAAYFLKDEFAILTPRNLDYKIGQYFFNFSKNKIKKNLSNNIIEIDTLHFYAPFFNMKKIKLLNFFDSNIFMYYDDVDLCRRVKNSNNKIYIVNNSVAKHMCGKSSNSSGYDLRRHFHFGWSTAYYYKKYYNRFFYIIFIYYFIFKSYLKLLLNISMFKNESINILKRIEGCKLGLVENKDFERTAY